MRVILTLNPNEVDNELIALIKTLLNKNAEIVIKKDSIMLEEYDASISLETVMQELAGEHYSQGLLADIEQGLKNSSIYAK